MVDSSPTAATVVFLALGSLGDLLPLLAIARRLAQQQHHDQLSVVVITHALYLPRLHALLRQSSSSHLSPLRLVLEGIPTPPLPPQDAGPSYVQTELDACLAACRNHSPITLLAFNLVAKFGVHLAEVLSILSYVLLHPSLPPPTPEPSLAHVKTLLGAKLFEMIQRVGESEERLKEVKHWMLSLFLPAYHTFRERHGLVPCISSFSSSSPSTIIAPSISSSPSSSSSLSSSPLSLAAHLALTGGTPLLYGVSELFYPKPGYWPQTAVFCGAWRWEEEEGSEEGMEGGREGWVPSEELRRFVEGEGGREAELMTPLDQKGGAPEASRTLLPSLPLPPLICFDMGSCVEVGLKTAEEWEGLIEGVVRALRRVFPFSSGGGGKRGVGSSDEKEGRKEAEEEDGKDGFRLLLQHFPPRPLTTVKEEKETGPDGGERKKRRVDEQQQQQQQQQQSKNILRLPLEEYVPHSWLFSRCHLVLHHGGLGSTMACIAAAAAAAAATAATGGAAAATAGAAGAAAAAEAAGAAAEGEVAGEAGMTTECVQGEGGWREEGREGGGGGVPQLVLPCTEEQRVWGERVAYLGLGAVVGREGGSEGGVEEEIYKTLKRLEGGREECLKTIRQYAGWLGEENGVGRAIEVLIAVMKKKEKEE